MARPDDYCGDVLGAQAAQPVLFGSLPKSSSTARRINWVSPLTREQSSHALNEQFGLLRRCRSRMQGLRGFDAARQAVRHPISAPGELQPVKRRLARSPRSSLAKMAASAVPLRTCFLDSVSSAAHRSSVRAEHQDHVAIQLLPGESLRPARDQPATLHRDVGSSS